MKLEYIRLHALVHLLMRFNLRKTFPLLTTKAYARLIQSILAGHCRGDLTTHQWFNQNPKITPKETLCGRE
ncbi:hypothetical protein YC2023_111645 [Brassica napus]